jgi:hypothetical protein
MVINTLFRMNGFLLRNALMVVHIFLFNIDVVQIFEKFGNL